MKIGTLTFHRACNYGGVLQCYALIEFLRQKGYSAEAVDYRCQRMERLYKLILTDSLKSLINSVRFFVPKYRMNQNFGNFRKKYIRQSNFQIHHAEELTNQYDLCIMGSDQVWCPRIVGGIDDVYFGNFTDKIRKVSYAASDEQMKWTVEQEKQLRRDLAKFSHISVREDIFAEKLKDYTDKEIVSVCDPTLLLTKEDWSKIAEEPSETDYVLYYQQESNPKTKEIIVDVARQIGAKKVVVVTGIKENYNFPYQYYSTKDLSVNRFLGLFKNAMCVFTSSFHGTAFSIIFRKNFYFVANAGLERPKNLLRKTNALGRMVYSTDKIKYSDVDYSKIEPHLQAFRQHSIDFLMKAIENG